MRSWLRLVRTPSLHHVGITYNFFEHHGRCSVHIEIVRFLILYCLPYPPKTT